MTIPDIPNSSERQLSAEYIAEEGGLMVDISNLIKRLETQFNEESFNVDVLLDDEALELPAHVTDRIGDVRSARVTYHDAPDMAIYIELYGQESAYYLTRYPDSTLNADTVIHSAPIDALENVVASSEDRRLFERNLGELTDENIEQFAEPVSPLPSGEFAALIMNLSNPNIRLKPSSPQLETLASLNIFDEKTFGELIDASRVANPDQSGLIEYDLLAADDAKLSYFYETSELPQFEFRCIDEQTGTPVIFRSDVVREKNKDGTFTERRLTHFPQYVTARGIDNDIVDITHDFAPSLANLKYMRTIIQQELESLLPEKPEDQIPEAIRLQDAMYTTTDPEDIIDQDIENSIAEHKRNQELLDIERDARLSIFLDSLNEDSPED